MLKIDLVRKLTSRKFWVAIVGLVTAILVIFNVDSGKQTQIIALITASATVIAYIVGEGIVDAANKSTTPAEQTQKDITQE